MKKISLALFLFISASFMIVFSACEKNTKKDVICSEITDMTICGDNDACKVVEDSCKEACSKLNATDCGAREDCMQEDGTCVDKPAVEEEENGDGDGNGDGDDTLDDQPGNGDGDGDGDGGDKPDQPVDEPPVKQPVVGKPAAAKGLACSERTTNCNVDNLSEDGNAMCFLNDTTCEERATPKFCKDKSKEECTDDCEWQSLVFGFGAHCAAIKGTDKCATLIEKDCGKAGCKFEDNRCKLR